MEVIVHSITIGIIFTILYFNVKKVSFIVILHIAMFALYILLYQIVSCFKIDNQYDTTQIIITDILLIVYVMCLYFFSHKKYLISADDVLRIVNTISVRYITYIIIIWTIFKIYLISKYGIQAMSALTFREDIGVSYLEILIDSLLTYPAVGAFFIYVIKLAYEPKKNFNLFTLMLWLLFLIVYGLFPGGARRFIAFIALMYLFFYFHKKDYTIGSFKNIVAPIIVVVVILLAFEGYQEVRNNLDISTGQEISISQAYKLLTTTSDDYQSLDENLEERPSPYPLIYEITTEQLDGIKLANGAIFTQSLLNVIPSIIFRNKQYINIDNVLADVFNFPPVDLCTTLVVLMQSELWLFGYILAPLVMVVLFRSGTIAIFRCEEYPALSLSLLGFVLLTAFQIETTLDTIINGIRDLALLFVVVVLANIFINFLKLRPRPGEA
jgi:hypothetical protein